jgi:hypothetical protein
MHFDEFFILLLKTVYTKPVMITTATMPHIIVWVNSLWTHACGWKYYEIVGKTPRILQSPKTSLDCINEMSQRLASNEEFSVTVLTDFIHGIRFVNLSIGNNSIELKMAISEFIHKDGQIPSFGLSINPNIKISIPSNLDKSNVTLHNDLAELQSKATATDDSVSN